MNLFRYSESFIAPKNPIASTIAKKLISILILALIAIFVAMFMMAYSLKDAEIINVSGSLRMQSYRLAYDIQSQSNQLDAHLQHMNRSLNSETMKSLDSLIVPHSIQLQYQEVLNRWNTLAMTIKSGNQTDYLDQVEGLVAQIDSFVFNLQHFSENKLKAFAMAGALCLLIISIITILIVRFARNKVVKPLGQLVRASQAIQEKKFDIQLTLNSGTELDVLGQCYQTMAKELATLYYDLELAVDKKTHELQQANDALQILYESSEALSSSRLSTQDFRAVLEDFQEIEGIVACRLMIDEKEGGQVILSSGEPCGLTWQSFLLEEGGMALGTLQWQQVAEKPEPILMESLGHIIARALYFTHNQKQTEQLILMQERGTIARELHDSLAQSLSYLKIQVTLLKRNLNQDMCQTRCETATKIVKDVDEVLVQAYTQLRELLSTFRLQIEEAHFGEALKQLLEPLKSQTQSQLLVDNQLFSIDLDAQQQVHLLQFIREAVLNAIKHAEATQISVVCQHEQSVINVTIEDDGIGFDVNKPKINHYGLSIMQERASRLEAKCSIKSEVGKGSQISLKMELATA